MQRILDDGFAYVSNGSVYFDVEKYNAKYHYGRLSGRNLEDIVANTRELDGQSDKRHSYDFALWKKAAPEHIMHWPSPWGEGFPGWHMECSAMSTKYLGERFDIHGGGMDLMFPHHECEIAQSTAALGHDSARFWVHNNMITINGQKMGKSLGNFITLEELFTGSHKLLAQAYSPMTIRFFVLQAHYRSTLDFSNEALQAAEKGLDRLMKGIETLDRLQPSAASTVQPAELEELPRGDGRRPELADGYLGPFRLGADDQPAGRRQGVDHGCRSRDAPADGAPLCLRYPRSARREGRRCGCGPRLCDAAGRDAPCHPPAGQGRQGLADLGPHPRRTDRCGHPRQGPQGRFGLGTGVKNGAVMERTRIFGRKAGLYAALAASVAAAGLSACGSMNVLKAREQTSVVAGAPDARQVAALTRHPMTVGAGECYDLLLDVLQSEGCLIESADRASGLVVARQVLPLEMASAIPVAGEIRRLSFLVQPAHQTSEVRLTVYIARQWYSGRDVGLFDRGVGHVHRSGGLPGLVRKARPRRSAVAGAGPA